MIVDFHTHTFPDKIAAASVDKLQSAAHIRPFADGTVSGLSASIRAAGIDCAVNLPVATSPRQVVQINNTAAKINEKTSETGVLSFGCVHPDFADYRAELGRVAALGIRGIKLHPPYQGADFDDIRYLRILDRAGELGLLALVHAGLDIGLPGADRASPRMIRDAVLSVGPVKLICAHMGGWRQWDAVETLLPDTGVFLDTSFALGRIVPNGDGYLWKEAELPLMDPAQFLRIVRTFGADRILFGTDSPWGGHAEALRNLRGLPLTDAERSAILGANAARLLGLS
ncbi:MAG: amidohydrolase family protein [Oscillospiraceae bacterium]|nr:amidohydrolase family protein [Oscillospiraceae bacterium]